MRTSITYEEVDDVQVCDAAHFRGGSAYSQYWCARQPDEKGKDWY